jgi:hypothetical protein
MKAPIKVSGQQVKQLKELLTCSAALTISARPENFAPVPELMTDQ